MCDYKLCFLVGAEMKSKGGRPSATAFRLAAAKPQRLRRKTAEPLELVSRTFWLLPLTTTKIVPEMS
jgi:hypothetical protein